MESSEGEAEKEASVSQCMAEPNVVICPKCGEEWSFTDDGGWYVDDFADGSTTDCPWCGAALKVRAVSHEVYYEVEAAD